MKLPLYQVDAFTDTRFRGNPAAVVPLEAELPAETMQAIAAENNLSETAFFHRDRVPSPIRWFTPSAEVELCGHATLAAAHVAFHHLGHPDDSIVFESFSGRLEVTRTDDWLTLDFPAQAAVPAEPPACVRMALDLEPETILAGPYTYLCVYRDAAAIRALTPDFATLAESDKFGLCATAPGDDCDFVSRFFAPSKGIPEDPVTGSAHCLLAPYWARRLGKPTLTARQLSARGGFLRVEDRGTRVGIGGQCVDYLAGTITID